MDEAEVTRNAVHRWVEAVESRNVDAVLATLSPDCSYRNVPEPPVVGHDAIRQLFARVLARSERVVFDTVAEAYEAGTGWLECVDRFWIDGTEYALACAGVFRVNTESGRIVEVRDYLDLTGWRQRMGRVGL